MRTNLPDAIAHAKAQLAEYFTDLRRDYDWSYEEVAKRSGVELDEIITLENATSEYRLATVMLVVSLYNVSAVELYTCIELY